MAADPRKRQKKLEHRATKRKEKKHVQVREQSAGLGERLAAACQYPILHTFVTEELWSTGMGHVLVSRELPGRSIAVAIFLIDGYCLGVKDAMAIILSRAEYDSRFVSNLQSRFVCRNISPATARKLVEEAVAYAHSLGLAPHEDYHKARRIFGDIDAAASSETFEFGKDGKPLFIAGPNDTPERCEQIMDAMARHRGHVEDKPSRGW